MEGRRAMSGSGRDLWVLVTLPQINQVAVQVDDPSEDDQPGYGRQSIGDIKKLTFVAATTSCLSTGAGSATTGGLVMPVGNANSFSCGGGSDAAGVRSGNSFLTTVGDVTISDVGATVAGVPVAAAAAVAAAVAGPATAAAYLIGGNVVFGTDGTEGTASTGLTDLMIIGSAFVLSIVDFLDGCFFVDRIGLGGSSVETGPAGVEVLIADGDFSFFSSLAGVLGIAGEGVGGGETSEISMTLDESRLDSSSLCARSCRYSSSSCRLRSS